MTAPMIWIQIDGLLVSVRFFHRPLSSDYRAIILGFLTEHVERKLLPQHSEDFYL